MGAEATTLKLDESQRLLASSPAKIIARVGSTFNLRSAFTLIEVMVAMVLLSLIVFALMAVFNGTQKAFRASITQTDILESGRAAMDLMARDLREMAPSGTYGGAVNFCVTNYVNYPTLKQTLVAVTNPNIQRTNILENFFILSRNNIHGSDSWIGNGYAVITNSPDGLYSLYRFHVTHPVMTYSPAFLFTNDFEHFLATLAVAPTNYSHLLDGVLDLRVRAFDASGKWISFDEKNITTNRMIFSGNELIPNEDGCIFYSNTLPMAVEIQMATLEDRALQHAESIPTAQAQINYLKDQAGKVHVFRQRVLIPNADPAAYQ
ncbi:MAG: PilW family protein [Limisphaerales bacterium]